MLHMYLIMGCKGHVSIRRQFLYVSCIEKHLLLPDGGSAGHNVALCDLGLRR